MAQLGHWILETIGPAKAEKYLANMPLNRTLREARVRRLADYMRRGQFRLTHQGIAFGIDGTLKDGQHRLQAIITSGCEVELWVYRGLDDDAMLHTDNGVTRTDADGIVCSKLGEADVKEIAVLKRMLAGTRTKRGLVHRLSMSSCWNRDGLALQLNKHREAIRFATSRLPRNVRGISHASVVAVVARASYTLDKEELSRFCEILRTGITMSPTESAAIRLRDFVTSGEGSKASDAARDAIYGKTQNALILFLEKTPIQRLYSLDEETFPIPE